MDGQDQGQGPRGGGGAVENPARRAGADRRAGGGLRGVQRSECDKIMCEMIRYLHEYGFYMLDFPSQVATMRCEAL